MSEKKSKIVKCVFTNDWVNPSGGTTYYHEITLENGDTGNCGTKEKYPQKLKEGTIIVYSIDDKRKIKITTVEDQKPMEQQYKKTYTNQTKTFGTKKQDDFLGYAWSYAKDLVVAGKTMQDVEELNKVARYIYEEIGKMLNNE